MAMRADDKIRKSGSGTGQQEPDDTVQRRSDLEQQDAAPDLEEDDEEFEDTDDAGDEDEELDDEQIEDTNT